MAGLVKAEEDPLDKYPEKLIDDDVVFKAAMNSNYDKIIDLTIVSENITRIDHQNLTLRKMSGSLRTLDLSFNLLRAMAHIDALANLRELNLGFNHLAEIEPLKLPNLHTLILNGNQITKIRNIRHLRKLERLSLDGNLIKDLTADSTEPLLELKELSLQRNQIKSIEAFGSFPNLEELGLSGNPLSVIFPEAFSQLKHLQVLMLDKVKFRYPEQDLAFLKQVEGSLSRLQLDNAFPKENLQSMEAFSFLKMDRLEELSLQQVGLLNIKKIEKICPNITVLDLGKNKIFAVEAVEALHKLEDLAEVSFKDNPICVHKHLKEMVCDVVPQIEVVNQVTLKEAGHRYKEELEALKQRVKSMSNEVGTVLADKHLAEAEAEEANSEGDEDEGLDRKAKRLDKIFNKAKHEEEKTDKLFQGIEKNFGLRVKALNEDDEDAAADPQKDVALFHTVIQEQWGGFKKQHREVVNNLRTREFETFSRVGESRGGSRGGGHLKIDL